MKNIAIDSMVLVIDPPSVIGTITKIGVASTKCKAGGIGIATDGYMIQISNVTTGALIPDSVPVIGSLNASSQKVKVEGKFVLLEGDTTSDLIANPKDPSSGAPVPTTFKVKIQSAGQNKATSN